MPGVNGSIIGLAFNGAFISCEISCAINFNREMLPASATDSGGWKEFISGVRDWNVNVNANLILEAVPADIKTLLTANYFGDLPLYIQFSTRPSATTELILSGNTLFQSGSITAPFGSASNWTSTLQGTGPLNSTFQDYALLIDALPVGADYPTIVNEDVV
jgi:predicted secreted protein